MIKTPGLIFGILLTFATAWIGVVAYSFVQLGQLQPITNADTGDILPPPLSGPAVVGQRVYAANGCVYCHSQQVRPGYVATDVVKTVDQEGKQIAGVRRTVARDYLRDKTAFLGTQRIGPDLTNFGLKEFYAKNENAVHQLLYEPSQMNSNSIMPSHRYLYKMQKIVGQQSANAVLGLSGPHAPSPGFEVVPTSEAQALVSYLLSLKRNYPLPEAPEEPAQ